MRRPTAGVLAAPYLVGVVLLFALPTAAAVALAFTEYHGIDSPRFVGWQNFGTAWDDSALHRSAITTAVIVALAVPVRLLLSVAAALLLWGPRKGAGAARTAVFLPSVVPDTAWALVWLWVLNPLYGPVAALLGDGFGLLTEPWPTRVGVAAMLAFPVGESFVVALAARNAIPASIYDAARAEGGGSWFITRAVSLPLMAPVIAFLGLRDVILLGSATFIPILTLTEGGPRESTTTLPVYLYEQGFLYGNLGYVSAVALLMLMASAVLTAGALWLFRARLR